MFRTGPLSIIRSLVLYAQQKVFVSQVIRGQDGWVSSILTSLADSQHNLYDKYLLLCIQYYTPDDGQ
jgi:hypothetical protein